LSVARQTKLGKPLGFPQYVSFFRNDSADLLLGFRVKSCSGHPVVTVTGMAMGKPSITTLYIYIHIYIFLNFIMQRVSAAGISVMILRDNDLHISMGVVAC